MLFLVNYMIMAQKKELTADEKQVIIYKGTERPFTGKYYDFKAKGTYAVSYTHLTLPTNSRV